MINSRFTFSLLFLLGSFLLIVSCEESMDPSPTFVQVRMTDDPLDNVQEVNIDLERIVVITDEGRDSFELGTNAGVYNLLDYQDEIDTLIGSSILNAETVHQIRLVLGSNNTIMVDSVIQELSTPSAQQSGLKINVQQDVSELDTFNILLDFDAEESVKETGNGKFMLKPVIRIVE